MKRELSLSPLKTITDKEGAMTNKAVAEVFPPGEFIREELEARGWTQEDLVEIIGRDTRLVNEIINGRRSITPETASALGEAFGTGAQFWMNLQSSYQLSRAKLDDGAIAHRSKIYSNAPVKLMMRRNWIQGSENPNVLEKQVLDFLGIKNLDEEPAPWRIAARTGTQYLSKYTPEQRAWVFRSRHLARAVHVGTFSDESFENGLNNLRSLRKTAEGIRHIPRVLAEAGIRFVIVEPLPRTKVDGVCLWLDNKSPVMALSLRYDRIDYFWHTLIHEMCHIKKKDGLREHTPLDIDLVGRKKADKTPRPSFEEDADAFASDFLVPAAEINNFIARTSPLYSTAKIMNFANRIDVHPGIVVGQLQYRDEIAYAHSRTLLVPVRNIVIDSSLTDGWGHMPPSNL